MNGDTEKLAGKLRAIETLVRMIKERKDKVKYTDLKFHKILELINTSDGFSQPEIEMLKAANKISGSIAHGNFSELMDKVDSFIHRQYFSNAVLNRTSVQKTTFDPNATGAQVFDALVNGSRVQATGDRNSDIFESYIVAKMGGYIEMTDNYADEVKNMVESKLK